jgi:hypothetical protein
MKLHSLNDLVAADGLAVAATRLTSAEALARGGATQRATGEIARGASLSAAVARTTLTAKGLIAESAQANSYTSRAGALGKGTVAAVNPVANHPLHDVLLHAPGKRRQGRQLKTGGPATIKTAITAGKYEALVVPTEHIAEVNTLALAHGISVTDRVECAVVSAEPLSIIESHDLTSELLTRVLLDEDAVSTLDRLAIAARSGAKDGLINATLAIVGRVVDDAFHGRRIDLGAAARAGLQAGAVSGARTSVQTLILMRDLNVHAGTALTTRTLRRAAAGATIVGAVADVVVATALDAIEVLRGKMSKDELLRRAGVHTLEAGGAAAGVLLAYYATRGAPWWVSVLAGIAGGYVGGHLGREVGAELFMPNTLPPATPLPLPAPYSTPEAP